MPERVTPHMLDTYRFQTGNITQRRRAISLENQIKTDLLIGLGSVYNVLPAMYRASSSGAYSAIQNYISTNNNIGAEIAGNRVSTPQMAGLAHVALIGAVASALRGNPEDMEHAKNFLSILHTIVEHNAAMQLGALGQAQEKKQVENVVLQYGGINLQLSLAHVEALGANLEVIKHLKDQGLDPFGR